MISRLTDGGNTFVVIEHHLDVIRCADWIVDLGPEGGEAGGHLVAEGTPERLAEHPTSHTGAFLRRHLARARRVAPGRAGPRRAGPRPQEAPA